MCIASIKEWLIPASTAIGLVSAIVAMFIALYEYRLKLRAETRLAEASNIESDVKLLALFVTLMDVAHARGPSQRWLRFFGHGYKWISARA
jgi:hypothetical protein